MSKQWYLFKNQQQHGPYAWEDIVKQYEEGAIEREDLLWSEGMDDWTRADQVEGLIPAVPPPPVSGPVSAPPDSHEQKTAPVVPPEEPSKSPPAQQPTEPSPAVATGVKSSTGLEPNIAGLLCYILGWISGIIFFLIESENKFVRFHAMQSIVTFGGLTVLQILIGILNRIIWSIL